MYSLPPYVTKLKKGYFSNISSAYWLMCLTNKYVMNVINTYLYTQNLVAVTTDERVGNTLTMYFTPNVKIYRGVDQTVRIQFKNRDNKATSILGKTAVLTLTDKDAGTTLLRKTIDSVDAAKGVGRVRFLESDLLNLD